MNSNSGDRPNRPKRISDDTSAAHTIVMAMEEIGYAIDDPDAFIQRVQHVEYGLSAEIEFAALLRWLGNCPFVHRLNEDALYEPSQSHWQIPDLLAVFRSGDLTCSAAIEVKTTKTRTLKFTEDYLQRLQSYAALVGQPLLIAWRPRDIGFWVLVDPDNAMERDDGAFKLDLNTAIKNDLMSLIAGDHYIVPAKGVGLVLEASRVGEKKPTPQGYEAEFRIDHASFLDSQGKRIPHVPDAIVWTVFSSMEESHEVTERGFVQRFVASGGMTRAQLVLRTAASFPLRDDERIHWKVIGTNLNAVISSKQLLAEAQAHIGTFVNYIFHQQPQPIPSFLPEGWASAGT